MKRTRAARARALVKRHPSLADSPAGVAARIGSTRQAVEAALAVTHDRPGRPGVESRTVRLSAELLDAVATAAKREGVSPREWIERAIRKALR